MTVCIATLFRWNYAAAGEPRNENVAAIIMSDRMVTAGDVQYEPHQQKVAFMTDRAVILIAGDYSFHSQALKETVAQIKGKPGSKPKDLAAIYGAAIQAIQRKAAEDVILAPLGLNTDSFLAQQKDMSPSFVSDITGQLQNYRGEDVDALIVGIGEGDVAEIYEVNRYGGVNCSDDIGFAAIGGGGWHARSRLMQSGYVKTTTFAGALALTYAAKRASEVAPGVGKMTDINIILKTGTIRLWPHIEKRLIELYDEFNKYQQELAVAGINQLQKAVNEPAKNENDLTNVTPITAVARSGGENS